jgi:hypothetical protein
MSSKGLGAKPIPNDHYATPTHAVTRLVWHGKPKRWGRTMQLREPTAAEKRAHVPPTWVNVVRAEDWERRGKKAEPIRSGWEGEK